ncbi:MAG: hypothetical protein LBV00_04465 [Propionibacteriaceae bacterium]|jgi:hypothetical protein|nr:hypothetical protein [Propionibacteriaceae bacterium]
MLFTFALASALASIVLITIRLLLGGQQAGKNPRRALMILWVLALILAGVFAAIDAAQTYVPGEVSVKSIWVNARTGRYVDIADYDVIREDVGDPPALMAFMISIVIAVMGLIIGGAAATGRNMASQASHALKKVPVFLVWFVGCLLSGWVTLGVIPVLLARVSREAEPMPRGFKVAIVIASAVAVWTFAAYLLPYILRQNS